MKTFIVAVLVVVVAILFYYPTFVQIPSTEEIKHQQASTPHAVSSPAAQPTTPTVTQAPSDVPPAAATASATALPTVAAAATAAAPASTVTASSTPAASTSASAPADNYAELPPLTGRKVIVVGGGLAGASAAIEALKAGAHVTIIEKTHKFGGNSEKASSGMNAARTAAQIKLSLKDSVEDFYKDTMASGHGLANPELVKVLTEQSASAYDFLTSFDINLSVVTKLGGHSRARTHRPKAPPPPLVPSNVGYDITSTLNRFLLERVPRKERLTVIASARVTELLVEDGRVVGVKYVSTRTSEGAQQAEEPVEVRADAVVLATGGYSRAQDLLAQYRPDLVDLPTTNGPFAEGDGIKIAEQINASVIHMDQVQIHPTSFILPSDPLAKTKFLAPEALRGLGGVLLNDEGKRFVNELDTRDHVSNAIFKHCQPLTVLQGPEDRQVEIKGPVRAYLIMIDEAVKEFPALKFYSLKGFVTAIPGYDELAEELGLPLENVKATLEAYNDCFVRQGHCNDPFGKKDFPYPTRYNDMYHVMQITPAIHYTMGGLEIDSEGRVLHAVPVAAEEGSSESEQHVVKEPIPGLFAAGEVTGGVHGANRLGGNSLLECVVFGRRAGRAAAASEASGSAQP